MSANNSIYINKNTFRVYEHGCHDNDFIAEEEYLIGQGKSLEEAIEIAEEFEKENMVEYGIHFCE
jgi:hypothetical protein